MAAPPTDFARILATLRRHRVRFIVVGGVAAVIEGAPVATFDLDIVPARNPDNIARLGRALDELVAVYRTRRDVRLTPTTAALAGEGHHLLMTRYGPLDVLGLVGAGRDFAALISHSGRRRLGHFFVHVIDLETQITLKREVGQRKDQLALPLLQETLRQRRRKHKRLATA